MSAASGSAAACTCDTLRGLLARLAAGTVAYSAAAPLPSSWDRWATLFEDNGYTTLMPGWPDDPETVGEAKAHPEVFAGKSIGQVADHFQAIIGGLGRKPAIIGHSFGGLLTQILAGRGLAAVSVAIDPAPFRGVLPLPISALRSASPVLGNPANRNRAVPLTFEQFRYGFANAVGEEEARQLYAAYSVPTSGKPLFQAEATTAASNPVSDHPFGPDAATILATEHWSLLGSRSLLWNEAMSRTTIFLSVLSAAIVALALLANATGFGPRTTTFALVLLPVVLFLGIATHIRVVEINRAEVELLSFLYLMTR